MYFCMLKKWGKTKHKNIIWNSGRVRLIRATLTFPKNSSDVVWNVNYRSVSFSAFYKIFHRQGLLKKMKKIVSQHFCPNMYRVCGMWENYLMKYFFFFFILRDGLGGLNGTTSDQNGDEFRYWKFRWV